MKQVETVPHPTLSTPFTVVSCPHDCETGRYCVVSPWWISCLL